MLNDLAFQPWVVHRAMAKLTEGVLEFLRAAEESGLLTTNHHLPMFCSDPVNPDSEVTGVRLHNLWVDVNSQEFQVVSPAMTQEFLYQYLAPAFSQYGAVQFGCCEDLTHKIEYVLRLPNLRIFVCSFWTNLDKVLEAVRHALHDHVAAARRQHGLRGRTRRRSASISNKVCASCKDIIIRSCCGNWKPWTESRSACGSGRK